MPKYKANAYLVKDGKIYEPNEEIELTEEQAKELGDKVTESKKNAPKKKPEKEDGKKK